MVIKASSAAEIRTLVDALGGVDEVQRHAAIARLGVIGARAIDRLTDAYAAAASRGARLAILHALELIGSHRSIPLARRALAEGGDVAVAAIGIFRSLLTSSQAAAAAAALDTVVATALDSGQDRRIRLAAFDALQEVPDVRAGVAAAFRDDPKGARGDVGSMIAMSDREAARAEATWKDAVDGRLPDRPEDLRDALGSRGATAPLGTLRALVDAVRARGDGGDEPANPGWLALRGSLHQVLALRGSRIALYDLREALEARSTRLPVSFLTALHVLGDASCLEPLASAWHRAAADRTADGLRWRQQLASAFRAIRQREKITKRHAVMKRITARWPALVE
jgi:hypothetical protein